MSQQPPNLFSQDISKAVLPQTTPYDVRPSGEWNPYDVAQMAKASYLQNQNTGVLGAALRSWAQRGAGGETLTIAEANKEFGLNVPGKPDERVSRSWAIEETRKKSYTKYYQQLSQDNPNANLLTGLAGGVAASLTDPAELLLNFGVSGIVGAVGKGIYAGNVARNGMSAVTKAGAALAGNGFTRNIAEAIVSSGVSTGLTAQQATQQDKDVFGPDGYSGAMAMQDTAVSAVSTAMLQAVGLGVGRAAGVSRNTLGKVVDSARAATETVEAAKAGRPVNPANTVDVPATQVRLDTFNTGIESALAELQQAQTDLARHNIPGLQADQSAKVFQDAFNAQELVSEAADALAAAEAKVLERVGGTDIVEAQRKLGSDVLEARKNIKILEAQQLSLDQTKPEGAARATELQAQVDEAKAALGEIEPLYKDLIDARALEQSVRKDAAASPDYEKLLPSVTHVDKPVYHPNSLKQKISVDGGRFNAPLDVMTVTSQFGMRHGHQHRGVDFGAPLGTPIKSSRGGTVTKVGFQKGGAGNYVEVDHGGGYVTKYFHMNEIKVKKGQKVTSKDLVGTVGNTGRSTGPHLHFEVWKDGKAVDPEVWLNKKTAIADAPPASRDVPPVRLPEDSPIHVHEFDEAALSARNLPELAETSRSATQNLIDSIGNFATEDRSGFRASDIADVRADIENRLEVLAAYSGMEAIDTARVVDAFERGGAKATQLIDAVSRAPEASIDVVTKILDNARAVFKSQDVRKTKEISSKIEAGVVSPSKDVLAKQAARQELIAEELPVILAAHRILEKLDAGRVTEELPIRYFMQMFGEDLSDFGKAIVGDFDPTNNQPLYRLRKQAVGRMLKEADGLRQLLGDIQKESGVKPYLSPEERTAQAAMAQVDETLKIAPPEDVKAFLEMAEQTKAEIDNIYQRYANTGLFDDASIRQMEGRAAEIKGKIDKGELSTPTDGGDKAKAAVTKLDNDKAYTAALEKVKDILFVCGARGLG